MLLHDNPRSSNAQKVRFLLAELGVPYERRQVAFGPERPAWHREVNPVGGIPALVDGEVRLAESNAILRYLASRESREDLYPTRVLAERARVDWLLDAIATTMRELLRAIEAHAYGLRPGRGIGAEPPDLEQAAAALTELAPRLRAFGELLDPEGWACLGRFTLVDVAAAPRLHRLRRSGLDLEGAAPRLAAWAKLVCARPAWQPVAVEAGV